MGDLPEMQTFECRLCRLAVTAEQVFGITEMLSLWVSNSKAAE
jgi:hypothetical protein